VLIQQIQDIQVDIQVLHGYSCRGYTTAQGYRAGFWLEGRGYENLGWRVFEE